MDSNDSNIGYLQAREVLALVQKRSKKLCKPVHAQILRGTMR